MDTPLHDGPHTHQLLRMTRRTRWAEGQFSFHPDTRVVCGSTALDQEAADEWALLQCTWEGRAWWYGWARLELGDEDNVVEGWLLVPRDPRDRGVVCG